MKKLVNILVAFILLVIFSTSCSKLGPLERIADDDNPTAVVDSNEDDAGITDPDNDEDHDADVTITDPDNDEDHDKDEAANK